MKPMLSIQEVAAIVSMDPETIRRKCASGQLRASKLGDHWRVSPAALDAWLESCEPEDPGVLRPSRVERPLRAITGGEA